MKDTQESKKVDTDKHEIYSEHVHVTFLIKFTLIGE